MIYSYNKSYTSWTGHLFITGLTQRHSHLQAIYSYQWTCTPLDCAKKTQKVYRKTPACELKVKNHFFLYFYLSFVIYEMKCYTSSCCVNSKHARTAAGQVWHRKQEPEQAVTFTVGEWKRCDVTSGTKPKSNSISLQFLMQIRPMWVNRHVHNYFHATLV